MDLQFEIDFVDVGEDSYVAFHILNGDFQDHIFFLGDLEKVDEFSYSYAKLDPEATGVLPALEPTKESSELAIALKDFFTHNREQIVDNYIKMLYNGKIKMQGRE